MLTHGRTATSTEQEKSNYETDYERKRLSFSQERPHTQSALHIRFSSSCSSCGGWEMIRWISGHRGDQSVFFHFQPKHSKELLHVVASDRRTSNVQSYPKTCQSVECGAHGPFQVWTPVIYLAKDEARCETGTICVWGLDACGKKILGFEKKRATTPARMCFHSASAQTSHTVRPGFITCSSQLFLMQRHPRPERWQALSGGLLTFTHWDVLASLPSILWCRWRQWIVELLSLLYSLLFLACYQ